MISAVHRGSDDWRGITSTAERRKRQNRLNQRARRQREQIRKGLVSLTENPASNIRADAEPSNSSAGALVVAVRNHRRSPGYGYRTLIATRAGDRHTVVDFIQRYFSDHPTTILLAPSDATNLARLNLLAAVSTNANTLGISWHYLEQDNSVSRFNCLGPQPLIALDPLLKDKLPTALQPTQLQYAVVHHPWIDLFPFAAMRNNIINALSTGLIDEDEFCESMFIMEPGEGALAPVAVWGPAQDVESWEISPTFFARWAHLMIDCPEALDITNIWRQKRGQRKLKLLMD